MALMVYQIGSAFTFCVRWNGVNKSNGKCRIQGKRCPIIWNGYFDALVNGLIAAKGLMDSGQIGRIGGKRYGKWDVKV